MVYWPSDFLEAWGTKAKKPDFSGKSWFIGHSFPQQVWFFGLGTPGLQKTTWPINHYGIPLRDSTFVILILALGAARTTSLALSTSRKILPIPGGAPGAQNCLRLQRCIPTPGGGPGEGPDCHPLGNQWFWGDSGPDPGGNVFVILIVALRAARSSISEAQEIGCGFVIPFRSVSTRRIDDFRPAWLRLLTVS